MLADLVHKHRDIVLSWAVTDLDHDGPNLRLKARVEFRDHSILFVRQVVLEESIFKYAYHWQDRTGRLICRWDNAPHWKHVATYPHHKHVVRNDATVLDSRGGDLEGVLDEIAATLRESACE